MLKITHKLFRWSGVDQNGCRIYGETMAKDADTLKKNLFREKILVLKAKHNYSFGRTAIIFNNRIRSEKITEFLRELMILIKSGIPLASAIEVINRNNAENSRLHKLLASIKKQIEKGYSLSLALRQNYLFFDDMTCNLIYAGEQSGTLEQILHHLSIYKEKIQSIKKQITHALLYPTFVCFIGIIVSLIMLGLVIPRFAALFNGLGVELPALTRALIYFAALIHQYFSWMASIVFLLIVGLRWQFKRSEIMRLTLDTLHLKIPFLGHLFKQMIVTRCLRTLSLMLSAGLPITEALRATAQVANNQIYAQEFMRISQEINRGVTLHSSFMNKVLFPERIPQLLAIGEESGTLEIMLNQLSDYFEERVNQVLQNIDRMLEPIIMLVLCVVMGVLIIAMYLPIFRLGSII